MTTALNIIRAAIPDADEALCNFILWGRTPFPCGAVSARKLFKAASRFRRATKNKIRLCDFCTNQVKNGKYICSRCDAGLKAARKEQS